MNVKEYIASGIIESYVLGLLTDPERVAFEETCRQYPEIAAARDAFEKDLESRLLNEGKEPPAHLMDKIQGAIQQADQEILNAPANDDKKSGSSAGIWKWMTAASLLLLAGAVYWAVKTNATAASWETRYRSAADSLQHLQSEMQPGNNQGSAFKMATIRQKEEVAASVIWDASKNNVYLLIANMPQPASDKQYQLWALMSDASAAPVNLGTFEINQEKLVFRMENVQDARAFAITLEPKGGSPAPTTTPMMSEIPSSL